MGKILNLEIDKQRELLEIHLNKEGAIYLRDILDKLIDSNENYDRHLMTPEWGGDELTSDKQNKGEGIKTIHHLKLLYWK